MSKKITQQMRRELVEALRSRYSAGSREEKTRILEEFASISGYHRKSAIRILNGSASGLGNPHEEPSSFATGCGRCDVIPLAFIHTRCEGQTCRG